MTPKKRKAIKQLVACYFRNKKGEPYRLTESQADIFASIIDRRIKWLWLSAPTRYGKSETLALALLYLAVFENLKIPIVAGSADKAMKIMEYVVQHLPDHSDIYEGLINKDISRVEQLKVTMAKGALRWSNGGWIHITSVDSRSIAKEGEGVVGEGGDVVVIEEAGLIRRKEQFSKIVRMPEEDLGWGKLIMSGNCIEGSVFEDAFGDDQYTKVLVKLDTAINEGRYTRDVLEKRRSQMTKRDWLRYYEVEFPQRSEFSYFKPKKYDVLPNTMKYYGTIDLALGETKKGCNTAIIVLGKDEKGQLFEVDSIGKLMTPDEAMTTIFNLPFKFTRFGVEQTHFQRYFLQVIEQKSKALGKYIPFEGLNQSRQKAERIESLEPFINTGQILFKGENTLWQELSDYSGEYKGLVDSLDALEMAWRIAQQNEILIGFV